MRRYLARVAPLLNDLSSWDRLVQAVFADRFGGDTTHLLYGPVAAVAECQKWFGPSLVKTLRPWRCAWDAAPFLLRSDEPQVWV